MTSSLSAENYKQYITIAQPTVQNALKHLFRWKGNELLTSIYQFKSNRVEQDMTTNTSEREERSLLSLFQSPQLRQVRSEQEKENHMNKEKQNEENEIQTIFSNPLHRVGIACHILIGLDLQRDTLSLSLLADILDDYKIIQQQIKDDTELSEEIKMIRLGVLQEEISMFEEWEKRTIEMSQNIVNTTTQDGKSDTLRDMFQSERSCSMM